MSLLEFEHVSKRYQHGSFQVQALRDVSLQLHECELVAIWGPRRSGRSTLLRLAAGIEAPDAGAVLFEGHDLYAEGNGSLASGIAYTRPTFRQSEGRVVLEQLTGAALALGGTASRARAHAWQTLDRVGAHDCAKLDTRELQGAEAVRVAIARALATAPSLLLIDEPTDGVDVLERDGILALLHSLAREGTAILTCVGESTTLFGADRALALSNGEIHGHVAPQLAPVVALPMRA
jgi:ABC-type cobalamin/Fe3+-siderophores transport system ATPase subunit